MPLSTRDRCDTIIALIDECLAEVDARPVATRVDGSFIGNGARDCQHSSMAGGDAQGWVVPVARWQ